MEKLLVKIFDRKKWIVNQAKQQTFLFEQHLASKCLIDGIAPPPWLCSSTEPSNVLNKQKLNSGVPLPRALPVIPISSHCSVFDKPAPTTLTGELPNGLCTELHVLDKGFGAGDKGLVLPQCSVSNAGCVSNSVPQGEREEDPSVTSPRDVRDARIRDIYHDLALSPARGAEDGVLILPQSPVSNAGCPYNGVPQDQRKEDLGNTSPEDQRDTRTSDIYHDPALSLARVQRSKSRQKALEIRKSAKKSFSQDKNNGIGHASGTIGRAISSLRSDHVDELNLVKPPDTSDYACEVEEAKIREFQSKERGTTISSGRITRSRSSGHQESSLNVSGSVCIDRKLGGALADSRGISPQQSKNVNKPLELVNYSYITNDSGQENEAKVGEHFIMEKGRSEYSGRTTRSRSASQEPNCLDELSKLEQSSNSISEVGVRNSLLQPKHFDEMVEVVKSCDIVDGNCEAKTKVGESWSKVTSDYSGRITRSRSSSQNPNDVNNYPKVDTSCISVKGDGSTIHLSTGKSTQPPQPLSTGSQAVHITEKIAKDAITNISGQRINQSTSSSSNKSHNSQRTLISAGRSVPIQCDIDLCAENSTDSSDKENDADHYAGTKTSAETNCTTEGMSEPVNSQALVHRSTQSRFAASSTHLSEKMTHRGTQYKEVPCTQTCEFVKAVTGGETEIDPGVSVEGSGSKLDGTGVRVGVEVLASRQPADCNVFVNPKQLNFDDVEESCRNGSYTLAFKEGMQGRSPEKRYISLMDADDIQEEGMTVNYLENHNLSLPMNFLGDPEVSIKGKDLQSGLSESPVEEDRSFLNGNAVSSVMETSDVHNDAVANTLLESGNRDSRCGAMGSVEHSPKAILESQGLSLSRVDVAKSIVSRSPVEEMTQNEDCHMIESSESSPKAQIKEGRISLGCGDTSGNAPFIFTDREFEASILSLMKQTGMMEETGVAHPPSIIIDSGSQCMEETTVSLTSEDNLTTGNAEHLTCAGRAMQEMRFDLGGTSNFGSPHGQSLDLIDLDDRKPELEGFVMQTDDEPTSIAGKGISFDEWNLPSTTIEHASILEQLCQSACMQTPVACSSASNKLHKIPYLYQSVPTGLLEGVDMRTMNDAVKQLKDGHSYSSEEVGQAFYGRSYSDCLLNHGGQSGWDTKKPYLSPVGKLWDITGSRTSSSRKRGSLNLELPCISEENENADEAADTFQDESVSNALNRSIQRVPLADITEIPNPPASVSKAEPYADRLSLDSVNTEFSLTGTHKSFKQRLGIQNRSKRRYNNKENLSMSQGTNDIKGTTRSLHKRFSKPKLSGKTSLRKGGSSLSEQEPKHNNIVSSMTSFIPLVQQKQAAAVVTGKRDVKVKALEAAEAAKRQAEKKENERKMKKEALKLERSRMEQENMKQLELQKKRKEEVRKKKEADMASKKRQREEEERKEKERKRMRIEARRNKREHEDKLPAEKVEKEMKTQAIDGRGPGGKESKDEMANKKMEEERGYDNNINISETKPSTSRISISNAGRESIVHEEFHEASSNYGYKAEVLSNSDRAMKNSVAITSQEQSYDISPYKESDDENDDDDSIIPNSKFIPSWSSKNCLAFAASSQNRADPETIFPPESFCCISEVLLPRKHQLNNSGMC
ncbi:hypothetical protein ACFX13_029552 [Malus domestica]